MGQAWQPIARASTTVLLRTAAGGSVGGNRDWVIGGSAIDADDTEGLSFAFDFKGNLCGATALVTLSVVMLWVWLIGGWK